MESIEDVMHNGSSIRHGNRLDEESHNLLNAGIESNYDRIIHMNIPSNHSDDHTSPVNEGIYERIDGECASVNSLEVDDNNNIVIPECALENGYISMDTQTSTSYCSTNLHMSARQLPNSNATYYSAGFYTNQNCAEPMIFSRPDTPLPPYRPRFASTSSTDESMLSNVTTTTTINDHNANQTLYPSLATPAPHSPPVDIHSYMLNHNACRANIFLKEVGCNDGITAENLFGTDDCDQKSLTTNDIKFFKNQFKDLKDSVNDDHNKVMNTIKGRTMTKDCGNCFICICMIIILLLIIVLLIVVAAKQGNTASTNDIMIYDSDMFPTSKSYPYSDEDKNKKNPMKPKTSFECSMLAKTGSTNLNLLLRNCANLPQRIGKNKISPTKKWIPFKNVNRRKSKR